MKVSDLKVGDILYGGKLAPWSKFRIRIPQYIIMLVTGGKTHVMVALYPDTRPEYLGNWIIGECTFPDGVVWRSISEIPESYTVHHNPEGWEFDAQAVRDAFLDDHGNPYDWPELIEFLRGDKVVRGVSNKWFVCSTWIQHIYGELGKKLWPGKSATPKDFGDWPRRDFEEVK